jgi:precorrin-6Y C5,15-methyltransferase (decarboxylating)
MEVVQAVLPEGLEALPPPDRVFIGGGGKQLGAIIEASAAKLKPGGRIVINTVLLSNLTAARDRLKQLGMTPTVIQTQVSRSTPMPWDERFDAQNPVWTLSGTKEE